MADMNDLALFMDSVLATNAPAQLANSLAIAVADAVMVDLTQATPADTGRAVSNWRLTLDSPAIDEIAPYVPSPKGSSKKGVWVHAVDPLVTIQANAPATIDAARLVLGNKQPGQPIFITNNLEYIQDLNRGTSDQTPAGFVERAQIIGEQVLQQKSIVIQGPRP